MKTITDISKTLLRASLILCLVFATSCSSDDDNSDIEEVLALPSQLLTTYTGDLQYAGPEAESGAIVVLEVATATISGEPGSYTVSFSDGVPSINNIGFSLLNDGRFVSVGSSTIVIDIDEEDLSIQAQQNGNNWVFEGDR